MILNRISLTHFKNYRQSEPIFHPKLNIITGLNGSGKTNLLDAIYYLCFCKSYFQTSDTQNILHEEGFFRLEGHFCQKSNNRKTIISSAYQKRSKKIIARNQVPYTSLTEHIGFCPLILIAPDDIQLINSGSSERRRLMDGTLSQFDATYLVNLMHYKKNLRQRNASLKNFASTQSFDEALLQSYDAQLVKYAPKLHQSRQEFTQNLSPIFQKFYNQLANHQEVASLEYRSSLKDNDFAVMLQQNQMKDRLLQRTSDGIHKDDLAFKLGDFPLKKLGSQGQKKSFLIALKLSFYEFIQQQKQVAPLLLLDDIFDKLDEERTQRLLEIVTQEPFGQIFITDTQLDRLQVILQRLHLSFKHFKISKGEIEEETVF